MNLDFEDIISDKDAVNSFRTLPLSRKTFFVFRIISLVVVIGALFQFLRISVFANAKYTKISENNILNISPISSQRGNINDRFGELIVKNEKVFQVVISPQAFSKEEKEDQEFALNILEELFFIDKEELSDTIDRRRRYFNDRIVVSSAIDRDDFVVLSQYNLSGVSIEEGFGRVHETPLVFSHMTGYTGFADEEELRERSDLLSSDLVGKAGIEEFYDEFIRGKSGIKEYFRDSHSVIVDERVVKRASKGNSVDTYIDKGLQEYFYGRLTDALDGLDRYVGTGIIMNPSNGEILALLSIPSYDAIRVEEYLYGENLPLFNRSIGGRYSPGSTIKPLVAVASLSEGVIDVNDLIYSKGYIEIPNPYYPEQPSIFKDWKAHGWVDVRSALARSSNVYFYEIGGGFGGRKGLGIERLKKWWKKFGLDEITKIDINGESSGVLPDPKWKTINTGEPWRVGDTYNVSIGQGDLLVSPIVLLNYISSIANGGVQYVPRIMKHIKNEANEVIVESNPKILRDIRRDISDFIKPIQDGMRDAVIKDYGTSRLLGDIPMNVWAKTGSAQVAGNSKTNAFFVGYASRLDKDNDIEQDPEIAMVIIIEDAKEGSLNVVPVARDVLQWYYDNRVKDVFDKK